MRSRRWKWVGLGAVAAIAVGVAVVQVRHRREWNEYDTDEIRAHLHKRFGALAAPDAPGPRRTSVP